MIHLTEFQTFLLLSILKVLVVLVITLTAVAYTVLLERKVLGRIQNRWGPSRVGPFGLLQPLADGIKLFLKEDLMPIASERPLFIIAPIIALTCALISIAVVPFGGMQTVTVNGVAIQMFNVQEGRFPKDLNELVESKLISKVPDAPYGMKIVYDPAAGKITVVKQ